MIQRSKYLENQRWLWPLMASVFMLIWAGTRICKGDLIGSVMFGLIGVLLIYWMLNIFYKVKSEQEEQ